MILLTYIWRFVFNIQCYLATLLGLSTITGDALVNYSKKHIYRALFDNSTHAIIGGLSWLIICLNHRDKYAVNTVLEIFSCTAISSLIDVDHFFMAKSLSLKVSKYYHLLQKLLFIILGCNKFEISTASALYYITTCANSSWIKYLIVI